MTFALDRRIVKFEPARLPCKAWLQQGSSWPGEEVGRCLLTFLRWIPVSRPGSRPHGLNKCAPHELERWKAYRYAASPYQFVDSNCVANNDGSLRMATPREREALMGFWTRSYAPSAEVG